MLSSPNRKNQQTAMAALSICYSSFSSSYLLHHFLRHPKATPLSSCLIPRPLCGSSVTNSSNLSHHKQQHKAPVNCMPLFPSLSSSSSFSPSYLHALTYFPVTLVPAKSSLHSLSSAKEQHQEEQDQLLSFVVEEEEEEEEIEEEDEEEQDQALYSLQEHEQDEETEELDEDDKEAEDSDVPEDNVVESVDVGDKKEGERARPVPSLTVKEKKELASYAHSLGKKLKCQLVGKSGVTDTVVMSFIETLEKNELLKIKIHNTCPGELEDVVKHLETATGSVVVGQIGRTVIVYRPSLTKLKAEERKKQARRVYVRKESKFGPAFLKMQKRGQATRLSGRGQRGTSKV